MIRSGQRSSQSGSRNRRTELFAVRSGDRAAVDNASRLCYLLRHSIPKEGSDIGVRFLCLCRGGDLASADCPNGFIRDHYFPVKKKRVDDRRDAVRYTSTHFQSSGLSNATTGLSCASTTSAVLFASRSAFVYKKAFIIPALLSSYTAFVFLASFILPSVGRARLPVVLILRIFSNIVLYVGSYIEES